MTIRAWIEHGSQQPLRAEIAVSHNTTQGFQRRLTLTEVDAVEAIVRAWLQTVLAEPTKDQQPQSNTVTPESRPRHTS